MYIVFKNIERYFIDIETCLYDIKLEGKTILLEILENWFNFLKKERKSEDTNCIFDSLFKDLKL